MVTAPTHLLHWRADGNDCELVLECVGHDQNECAGYEHWGECGEDLVVLTLVDPAFPIPVAFASHRWEGDPADLGWWCDDGPIIVRDPRVAS